MIEINDTFNKYINEFENNNTFEDLHGHGKAFPYIGWYWRNVDFEGEIPVGDCGQFIGFIENNKWDYPERNLTELEKELVTAKMYQIIEFPIKYNELWELLQTFKIEASIKEWLRYGR